MFWKKDVSLKIATLKLPGEIAIKIREKYLLKGSFLVKLQASSLMSKKNNKSLVKSSDNLVSVIDNPDHF